MRKRMERGCSKNILKKEFRHLDELMKWLSVHQKIYVESIAYCTKQEIKIKKGESKTKKFVIKYTE